MNKIVETFLTPFIALCLVASIFLILPAGTAFSEDLETQCAAVSESNTGCPNLGGTECRALLEKCADYYDQQSAQISQDITKTTQQKNTLQNQITTLKKKVQNLEYQIGQSNVMVKDLSLQIDDTEVSITKTSGKIDNSQTQIKNILQSVYEEDQKPSIQILLEGNLSDFFDNLAYLESLNSQISSLLDDTKNLKNYLEEQKDKMDGEVGQLQKTIVLQGLQKKENEQNKKEQEQYLKLTEAQYQQQIKDKQDADQKASKIKAQLFQMLGVSKVPTFGEALEVAKTAANITGIRPAFLLAIISQESAIGRNVGQCVLVNTTTGSGKRISTGATVIRVMKPTRDVAPFLEITKASGRDPFDTPVSCWIPAYYAGSPSGWGGAMGPAQFIPSTWNLFTDRLKVLLGKAPDPWGIKDSFTAAGLYLADLGASAQTTASESKAAGRYYGVSGSYNSMVMRRANCIQIFIDSGTMTTSCQNLIF